MSTYDSQVGGDHYKQHTIQPWHIWEDYHLDPWEASAIAYILRCKDKSCRAQDLHKAIHYLQHCISRLEQGKDQRYPAFQVGIHDVQDSGSQSTGHGE